MYQTTFFANKSILVIRVDFRDFREIIIMQTCTHQRTLRNKYGTFVNVKIVTAVADSGRTWKQVIRSSMMASVKMICVCYLFLTSHNYFVGKYYQVIEALKYQLRVRKLNYPGKLPET